MKLILILAGMYTSKIVAFAAQRARTHPKRVTVCCGFWSRSIIGPFSSKMSKERPFSQWRSLSERIFVYKNWKGGGYNIWFQQDGDTWHKTEVTLNVLRLVFEDLIISRRADFVWPPRNCDLTPFDYYLWGATKDKCYADKPETIDAIKDKIRKAIVGIQLHTIDNVLKNWIDRVGYRMASRGSRLNESIFHYYPDGLYFQIKTEIWENIQ